MMIDGIVVRPLNEAAQKHGRIPVFVRADDETMDDEIQLRTATGQDTGIAVQLSGRFYTATEFDGSAMWFGIERRDIRAAFADAIARFTSR
jgi:hypothetical protein